MKGAGFLHDRPFFPPPPVLGRPFGRNRYADRLRPNSFEGGGSGNAMSLKYDVCKGT